MHRSFPAGSRNAEFIALLRKVDGGTPVTMERRHLSWTAEGDLHPRHGRTARPTVAPGERMHSLRRHKEFTKMTPKNTICLWFDTDAEAAARFYAATFPDSRVTAVHKAPSDYPSGKAGDVLTVNFTVVGIPCLGLNGGPQFKQTEAFSFQIATDDQAETDRYWNAIVGNGGQESACGWCKDRWGLNWQITPRTLTDALAAGGAEAKRAFEAMMTMRKIDVATIEAARRG
jgi:predicted 3-demethylubiquinone-9 3-methyltransferase (glyoxalase superfamily)